MQTRGVKEKIAKGIEKMSKKMIPSLDADLVARVCRFPPGTAYDVYELKFFPPPPLGKVEYWTHYHINADGTYVVLPGDFSLLPARDFVTDSVDHVHVELGITRSTLTLCRYALRNANPTLPIELAYMVVERARTAKRILFFYK